MANIKISELTAVSSLNNGDLVEVSQVNALAPSGYTSLKATMADLGSKVNKDIEYTTDLADFTDKTITGAIKETAKDKNVADEYDDTQTYDKGDVVIYKNTLYICTTNNTTGTWDATKWTATTIDNVIGDLSTLTTSDKSSLVGAVNEVVGDTYTKSEVDTALNNKTDKNTVNNYALSSSNPIIIFQTGAYHTFLIVGFVQGIGVVTLLAKITNSTTSVIDFVTGSAFSNANLTFAYNPSTKAFVIQTPQSGASNLTIIRGGST